MTHQLYYIVFVDDKFSATFYSYSTAFIYADEQYKLGKKVEIIDSYAFHKKEKLKKILDKRHDKWYNKNIERR